MDITLDKTAGPEASIKIKLNEADYQKNFEDKLRDYSKKASIKGFRPGKVPSGLIKKLYGRAILIEEINDILVKSLTDYIKGNDIKIIGDPLPAEEEKDIDWENQKEFEFEYNIGLVDEFDYNLDLKLTRYNIRLSDKEFAENIDNLRDQYGKMLNPEQSEEGDSLFGTLAQQESDFSKDSMLYIEKVSKKLRSQFVGLKKDDKVTFELKSLFTEKIDLEVFTNKTEEEIKELKGEFTFTVKNINRIQPAELNQEFFDKIFGAGQVKSEEEFKEKYKTILEENLNREADYFLSQEIQKKLTESTKINIPSDFYKKWLLKSQNNLSKDQLEKDFEHYVRDLKWSLIKNKIADDNEVKVEQEDVIEKTKKLFREQFGGSLNEEMESNLEAFANNYLNQNNGENYYYIFNQARTEKLMAAIKEKIKIAEKEVTRTEFEKKVQE